ncbi:MULTISPECIES: GNAT family N-acetyltransferase [unclassified Paenibacillus]|uniref:GNAT family N-acetyltransferase n=1 Tax=unclassified Paenibacillus TaxID=185978 RepID=UPI000693B966|nr:GNAT family N-acetyltransferase [Paenibacillus sp. FSL P4-0081]
MEIRKAVVADAAVILENRLVFIEEVTHAVLPANFKEETYAYIQENLANGRLVCYIATEQDRIISIAVMSTYEVLPTVSNPSGKKGYLYNVHTAAAFRRQGLFTRVLHTLIEEAERLGIAEIFLDYTADGRMLYEKLGFKHLEKEMVLKIR